MKSKASILISLAFLIILALSSASAVSGQENGPDTIARRGSNTQVQWRPQVAYESATLTVTGPNGYTFQRTFPSGVMPHFKTFSADGSLLASGSYTYEIRLTPALSAETKADLAAASDDESREQLVAELTQAGILPDASQMVIYGYLTVQNGKFLSDNVEETYAAKDISLSNDILSPNAIEDQVILDDLIVDGSACIGQDCVNGESFGFDTLRLKENNLRIKAQDTSNTASFPSNDWQITFNDSSNGGANKFSIDDIDGGRTPFTIEAAARSNALYVENDGDIGMGTSNPVVNAHIVDGNTPTVRLEQDGSSGFTAQTWDLAGNEANFFIRDVTNGSKLSFRIRPGAPESSIDIAGDGDIGMGTSSPETPLHIRRTTASDKTMLLLENNGATGFVLENTNFGAANWEMKATSSNAFEVNLIGSGGAELNLAADGTLVIGPGANTVFTLTPSGDLTVNGQVNGGSSRDLKENFVVTNSSILDRVMDLSIYYYNYKTDEDSVRHISPTAEDFMATFNVGVDNKHISTMDMAGVALAAIQELYESVEMKEFEMRAMQTELATQQERIAELEAQNADLEARLAALEAIVLAQMEQEGDR